MRRIVLVAGARPNFMKIAPLVAELERCDEFEPVVVHTGQHYDITMSDVFFEQLGIPEPHANLGIGGGSREEQIERISTAFDLYLTEHGADMVLVVGDVNSTVACSAIARARGIPTIHVEAGLRSFDRTMPEELNRIATDEISDYLFVTEQSGMRNLENESVQGQAFLVGNVMIDSLVRHLRESDPSAFLAEHGLSAGAYVVATFHRPSNVDHRESLASVLEIIEYAADQHPLLIPLHPRTRKALERFGWLDRLTQNPRIVVSEPLGYLDFIGVVRHARAIVTDSGGLQEETTYLGVPCVTMRDNTERPVTVEVGTNVLAGTDPANVIRCLDTALLKARDRWDVPELWDGNTAGRIVEILRSVIRDEP